MDIKIKYIFVYILSTYSEICTKQSSLIFPLLIHSHKLRNTLSNPMFSLIHQHEPVSLFSIWSNFLPVIFCSSRQNMSLRSLGITWTRKQTLTMTTSSCSSAIRMTTASGCCQTLRRVPTSLHRPRRTHGGSLSKSLDTVSGTPLP